jgi:hypothetical protein
VVTARTSFAMPLLQQLLEVQENSFELLGLKFLSSLSMNQARVLTPFDVENWKWQSSIDALVSTSDEKTGSSHPGWISIVVRKVDAHREVDSMICTFCHSYVFSQVSRLLQEHINGFN